MKRVSEHMGGSALTGNFIFMTHDKSDYILVTN